MVFAQKAADDQETVTGIDVRDGHAQPRKELSRLSSRHLGGNDCPFPLWGKVRMRVVHRLFVGRTEIRLAQTEIHVVAAQPAHQFLQQIKFFQRAVRCGQRRNLFRTVCSFYLAQTIGYILQRGLPCHFDPLAVLLQHRLGQTLRRVQPFITEPVLVGNPAFVDGFILDRQNPHHFIVHHLDGQIGAQAIVRADRLAPRQLPVACGVAERFAGQRAHRAQVDHVAG